MKKYLFLLFIPIIIFSCKKDDDISAEEQAKIDKAIIQKYISDSSLVADSTTSGLYYVIADSGTGTNPNSNSYLTVYYKGYLIDGTVFDQNPSGQPIQLFLHQTINGWIEGLQLVKKGGKIKLLIPSALGYGTKAQTKIPANSVLIFDIELQNFQ